MDPVDEMDECGKKIPRYDSRMKARLLVPAVLAVLYVLSSACSKDSKDDNDSNDAGDTDTLSFDGGPLVPCENVPEYIRSQKVAGLVLV